MFWLIPSIGWCDTLDYWHIYHNEKVIAKFNALSDDLKLEIGSEDVNEEAKISIRHFDDTPCINCLSVLFVRDEKKRKLRIVETDETWGVLSLELKDLIDFGKKNGSKRYDFYYWEKDNTGKSTKMKLVLQLTIKE